MTLKEQRRANVDLDLLGQVARAKAAQFGDRRRARFELCREVVVDVRAGVPGHGVVARVVMATEEPFVLGRVLAEVVPLGSRGEGEGDQGIIARRGRS